MSNKKILLATVGGQGGFKTICEEKPHGVYFLQTDRSKDTVDEIVQKLQNEEELKKSFKDYDNCEDFVDSILSYASNFDDKIHRIDIEDHEKITETFNQCRSIISDLQKEDCEVIIDFTGGTKPMAIGLYLAALGEGCQYAYVGGERVDDLGVVKEGYEKLTKQKDPYQHYAVNEFKKGFQFFNRYQFDAARTNFELAKDNLSDEDLIERAELFIKIVNLYESWDRFNDVVINSNISLNDYLKDIINTIKSSSDLSDYFNKDKSFLNQLVDNQLFLVRKLNRKLDESINYYLPDLLNNANRRIEEGKYDDAVARLYRAVELIAQLSLYKYKLIDNQELIDNKAFRIVKNKLKKKSQKVSNSYILENEIVGYKKWNNDDEFLEVGLYKNYKILECLSENNKYDLDIFAKKLSSNFYRINQKVQDRNKSILAHGLKPMNYDEAKGLYKLVLNHAIKYCDNVEYEMKKAQFPKFIKE